MLRHHYRPATGLGNEALDVLYQTDLLDGYRNQSEGAYLLVPGGANRVNLHCPAGPEPAPADGVWGKSGGSRTDPNTIGPARRPSGINRAVKPFGQPGGHGVRKPEPSEGIGRRTAEGLPNRWSQEFGELDAIGQAGNAVE